LELSEYPLVHFQTPPRERQKQAAAHDEVATETLQDDGGSMQVLEGRSDEFIQEEMEVGEVGLGVEVGEAGEIGGEGTAHGQSRAIVIATNCCRKCHRHWHIDFLRQLHRCPYQEEDAPPQSRFQPPIIAASQHTFIRPNSSQEIMQERGPTVEDRLGDRGEWQGRWIGGDST